MTEPRKLIDLVRGLPGKEKRANLIARLNTLVPLLQEARNNLVKASTEAPFVWALCGRDAATDFGKELKGAGNTAKRLRNSIQSTLEDGPLKGEDTATTRLREQCTKASTIVTGTWANHVQSISRNFDQLIAVGEQARLPGVSALRNALDTMSRSVERPPKTEEEKIAFERTRDALPPAVAQLGLVGKSGEFLVAASRGEASAKGLLDPEVQSFLKQHDQLWATLKVKLG